eukprot:Skav208398  [mRNA]  locus=scaffold1179:129575:130039:+ [translate_table: standard]
MTSKDTGSWRDSVSEPKRLPIFSAKSFSSRPKVFAQPADLFLMDVPSSLSVAPKNWGSLKRRAVNRALIMASGLSARSPFKILSTICQLSPWSRSNCSRERPAFALGEAAVGASKPSPLRGAKGARWFGVTPTKAAFSKALSASKALSLSQEER